MKDSKKYSDDVRKLYRSLKRKYPKVEKVEYEDVTEAVVHSLVLESLPESVERSVFKRFEDHFVDFNDMRVSRPEEIVDMLGEDSEQARKTARKIIQVLRSIFRKYNNVELEALKKMGKREARGVLEKFEGMSSFCVDYCMLTALDAHAVPVTDTMIKYLRDNELVHPQADRSEIEGFLSRQIPAKNAYEFYALLRRVSEGVPGGGKRKKTTKRRKISKKKKTTKKKKTKKRTKKESKRKSKKSTKKQSGSRAKS